MRVSDLLRSLRSVYDDWSDFLVNPQFIRRNQEVAWSNFSPRILNYPVLKSDVIQLVNEGQYSFQIIEDGSIIQIYYLCQKSDILRANLSFYSTRVFYQADAFISNLYETTSDLFQEIDTMEELLVDEMTYGFGSQDGPVSWLRIDYAPQDARGVLHHDCHLHMSTFSRSRFVVDGVPTPKQFIELIMSLCYPEYYRRHRLDQNWNYRDINKIHSVNRPCVQIEESEIGKHISHFRIPRM